MYTLPVHLHEKFIRNATLKNVVLRCWHDGIEYKEMLEMALSVQTERTEDLERRLANEEMHKGAPAQIFVGCFKGKDIFATQEVKELLDCLQGQINHMKANKNSENEFTGVGFG